jgi:hypothetical protein
MNQQTDPHPLKWRSYPWHLICNNFVDRSNHLSDGSPQGKSRQPHQLIAKSRKSQKRFTASNSWIVTPGVWPGRIQ